MPRCCFLFTSNTGKRERSGLAARQAKLKRGTRAGHFAVICLLGLLLIPFLDVQAATTVPANILLDPGFENSSSTAWSVTQNYGNGSAVIHDTSNPHTGRYSARLSAINKDLVCSSTECKDSVGAAITQLYLPAIPLSDLENSQGSFSAWWYLAPSTLPPYSLHIELFFSDNSIIEYWYGRSDLTNSTIQTTAYNLGNLSQSVWFQTSRNLTADIERSVVSPATTTLSSVLVGAYGGSYMDCSTSCPATPHGETAWIDDVSVSFNINPPVAAFTFNPTAGNSPLAVGFNASQSYEQGGYGSVSTYKWNFGDGTVETISAPAINHTFVKPGLYNVTLTVYDNYNIASAPSSTTIRVSAADYTLVVLVALGGLAGLVAAGLPIRRRRRERNRARRR